MNQLEDWLDQQPSPDYAILFLLAALVVVISSLLWTIR